MRALAWNMASGPRTLLGVNMLCTTGNDIGSPCHVAFASLVLPLGPVGRCDTNDVECPKIPLAVFWVRALRASGEPKVYSSRI